MDLIIKKYLKKLKEFNSKTPFYFEIEEPLEILWSYDNVELYRIIQFDIEIKNILESFLMVCYTARILYENIDFISVQKTIEDTIDLRYFMWEMQLLDILRTISLYYDFIELKTDISLYYQNLNKLIDVLSKILANIENLKNESTDGYMYSILSENLNMLNDDIVDNKIDLKRELNNILSKRKNEMEFSDFSLLMTEYCLAVFNQEKLLDSICYIKNVYEFIVYYGFESQIAKQIVKEYDEFIELFTENQKIQKRLYSGQKDRNLI